MCHCSHPHKYPIESAHNQPQILSIPRTIGNPLCHVLAQNSLSLRRVDHLSPFKIHHNTSPSNETYMLPQRLLISHPSIYLLCHIDPLTTAQETQAAGGQKSHARTHDVDFSGVWRAGGSAFCLSRGFVIGLGCFLIEIIGKGRTLTRIIPYSSTR